MECPVAETSKDQDLSVAAPVTPQQRRLAFAGLILAMIMASLDQNIVATALPHIATELGGLAHISWVVTAFMLTTTVATPMYGKLSDMYGRRPLFAASILIFLGASVLCGTAHSMAALIGWRALQGLGAGGLMTLSQTVISDLVPLAERPRYQGLFTGAFALSSVAGPLLGGVLTDAWSWRWVFLVNLPVGGLALLLVLLSVPPLPTRSRHEIDYGGALSLALATATTLMLLSWGGSLLPWLSPAMALLVGAALLLLRLFLRCERRAREPVVSLHLFRIPSFGVCVGATAMMAFAMMGSMVFMPLYFQLVLGLSPTGAGLTMLPQMGMMLLTSIGGGQVAARTGRTRLLMAIGVGLETLGLGLLAWLAQRDAALPAFLAALAVLGTGMGIGMPNATVIVQNVVPRGEMGAATAAMSFLRSLGGALGVALSGGVVAAALQSRLAELAGRVDAHQLMEQGLAALHNASAADRAAAAAAYRLAIATSLEVGTLAMSLAFLTVLWLLRLSAPSGAATGR